MHNMAFKLAKKILDKQLHQIKVLQSLPEKWETQTRFMDIAELMGALSKTWKRINVTNTSYSVRAIEC